MKVRREEVLAQELVALWSSEASTETSHNEVLGIVGQPETGGDGSSADIVDVGISLDLTQVVKPLNYKVLVNSVV